MFLIGIFHYLRKRFNTHTHDNEFYNCLKKSNTIDDIEPIYCFLLRHIGTWSSLVTCISVQEQKNSKENKGNTRQGEKIDSAPAYAFDK